MNTRRLPTFLFIGPDKTGSSWIFEYLRRHPQCFVPECKDLYFFDQEYHRGIDWYLRFFDEAPVSARALGEFSHDYLLSGDAAERIARDLPGIRLITSLRDPVDRTFSHYLYLVRSGLTRKPFWEAVEEFPRLLDNSMYARLLAPYQERFDASRMLYLRFDDLRENVQLFADQICAFLDIDPMPATDIGVVRAAARPRSHWVAKLLRTGAVAVRRLGFPDLVGLIKHSRFARWFYRPYRAKEKPALSASDRARLRRLFLDDIRETERITGLDLSAWRESPEQSA